MTRSAASLDVIIPARNAAQTLGAQLAALGVQRDAPGFAVTVVDDGSTDGTADLARRRTGGLAARGVPLDVVRLARSRGANGARNAGIAAGRGPLVLLCDADDVVGPSWVRQMTLALGRTDVVGGRVVEDRPPAWRGPLTGDDLPTALGTVRYAVGASMGMHRRVWEALGGFDEAWRMGGTEVEFCARARAAGFSLAFAPDAHVAYRSRRGVRAAAQAWRWGRATTRLSRSLSAISEDRSASLAAHVRAQAVSGLRRGGRDPVGVAAYVAGLCAGRVDEALFRRAAAGDGS